ncbi:MAG: prephenate dehydrogenase/arogenate dehydrogenase family protein [Deltaproteobacteria bacterium]|nr:prephenate dehydrogenase/arogenate dehydrogenase family protein [Deltaproteobacteria bacterium]
MSSAPYFKKVTIIGVGLIGGSLAISLKEKGMVGSVTGVGRSLPNLERAVELGVIDDFTCDATEGVKDADLIFIAVPVTSIAKVVSEASNGFKVGAIITDGGSVKGAVIDAVKKVLPKGVHFVPGHPIAGTEHSGVEAAFLGLYTGKRCILTPTEHTDKDALKQVHRLWEAVGSDVVIMDSVSHDLILAAISHLPHVIAYSLVNTVAESSLQHSTDSGIEESGKGILSYSAGGFKDFTRIASSSPDMWTEICALNKDALLRCIDDFEGSIKQIRSLIAEEKFDKLNQIFSKAKKVRDSLIS